MIPRWVRPFFVLGIAMALPPLFFVLFYRPQRLAEAEQQHYETLSVVGAYVQERLETYDTLVDNAQRAEDEDREPQLLYLEAALNTHKTCVANSLVATGWRLVTRPTSAEGGVELRVKSPECGAGNIWVAPFSTDGLIPWTLVQNAFDGLLVFDGGPDLGRAPSDAVLLGQDSRLPQLPLGSPVVLTRSSQAINLQQALAGRAADPNQPKSRTWLHTTEEDAVRVQVAGVWYRALLQPVSAAIESIDRSKHGRIELVVAALLREDLLSRRAIALPPRALTEIVGLLALGILALPFIKLRVVGKNERMRARDVWLLGGSILLGSAVAFLLVVHAEAVDQLQAHFDTDLRRFADDLAARAREEASSATETLRKHGGVLLDKPGEKLGAILSQYDFQYPLFDLIFTAGVDGWQHEKWLTRTPVTAVVSVHPYDYFREGLAFDPNTPTDARYPAVFDTQVAPTTGRALGTFVLPVRAFGKSRRSGPKRLSDGIVALATPMVSLNAPPVEKPFRFVVLDEGSDRVLFSGTPESLRGDHFLASIASSDALARLLLTKNTYVITDQSYRNRDTRMTWREIPALHARLVAFYHSDSVELLATQMVGATAATTCTSLLLVLLAVRFAKFLRGDAAIEWAWPSARRARFYALAAGSAILLSFLLLMFTLPLDGDVRFWIALTCPALVAFAICLTAKATNEQSQWAGGYPWPFVAFGVVAITATVVVPTKIFFDDSFALGLAAHHWSAKALLNQERKRERAEVSPIIETTDGSVPKCGKTFTDPRCAYDWKAIVATKQNEDAYVRRLRHFRYADTLNGELEKGFRKPSARLAMFERALTRLEGRKGFIAAGLRRAQDGYLLPLGPQSEFSWSSMGWIHCVILLASLWLLGLLVYSLARNVLGVELDGDGVLPNDSLINIANERRLLLLRPLREIVPATGIHRIDLRDPDLEPGKLEQLVAEEHRPGRSRVEIVCLESRIADPQWRQALLKVAEDEQLQLLIFVSEIDPLYYLSQRLREQRSDAANVTEDGAGSAHKSLAEALELEVNRWSTALQPYKKVRFGIDESSRAKYTNLALTHHADRLWDECKWSAALLSVMQTLCSRTDLNDFRWEEVSSFIGDAAEPYYRSMWALSSREEKLAMIQLAEEGLINPKSVEIIRRLARRRLVRIDPRYRLMNDSFGDFVRNVEPDQQISTWERSPDGEGWARIGPPLYALGAMAFAVLLFTEQDSSKEIGGLATAITTALTSLRSILSATRGRAAGTAD